MTEPVENMKEYEEDVNNMKKYVENMKEYPLLYCLWDLEKFQDLPLYTGSETWKYSEFFPPCKLWPAI